MNGMGNFIWPFLLAKVVMKDDVSADVANRTAVVAALSALNPAASLLVAQEKKKDEVEKQNLIANNIELQKRKIDLEILTERMNSTLDKKELSSESLNNFMNAGVFTPEQISEITKIADQKFLHLSEVLKKTNAV